MVWVGSTCILYGERVLFHSTASVMPNAIHAILLQKAAQCAFPSTASDCRAETEVNLKHFRSYWWSKAAHWEHIQTYPCNNYHYFSSFKLQNDAWPSYFLASTSAKGYESHEDWNNPHRTDVTTLDAFTADIFLWRSNNCTAFLSAAIQSTWAAVLIPEEMRPYVTRQK